MAEKQSVMERYINRFLKIICRERRPRRSAERKIIMNNKIKKLIKAAAVRTVKTVAETALAIIGTNMMSITEVDWLGVLSAAALAGVVTILTCIKGLPEVKE